MMLEAPTSALAQPLEEKQVGVLHNADKSNLEI
jgi:hypothetical protein